MKGKVQFEVGESTFALEIDEGKDMETLHKLAVLGNPPKYCKELPNGFLTLESNKDKDGNTYVNVVCKGNDAEGKFKVYKAKLGSYKSGGYFWHRFQLDEYALTRAEQETSESEVAKDIEI